MPILEKGKISNQWPQLIQSWKKKKSKSNAEKAEEHNKDRI